MEPLRICTIVAVAIIIFILYLVRDHLSGLLKDQSSQSADLKPYSLSRVLFSFWTLLVFFSICYIIFVTGELPDIKSSTLALMGIAAGTTVAGRAIDNIQAGNPNLVRIQDLKDEGFLTDILSDANGVSISRFQTLCFNLIYGGFFLSTVFAKNELFNFKPETLTLLGLSSGAYALLKIPESQPKPSK
ncbi:hypothetical protein [Mucilaginibacter sp. BT774]|uniref:hypothetical protein n=1 Tax=Mucilaginibacter sp. BT774 TaxID=3062276 RepID=UPI002676D21C|nr:hypothetical protein [Mucilaginibacter sp. BT774]MDO3627579.1 hypothetical protein [Mucilaginibacter sp. BT774]